MNASILSVFEACAAATGRTFRRPTRGTVTKCPLHDDRQASFSVNEDKGVFQCFAGSCAMKGGVLDVPVVFGIAKDHKESSRWLAQRGLIPQAQGQAFRVISAPNRVYTDIQAMAPEDRVWRYLAIEDLRKMIGEMRLRAVRDHIAELRYARDRADGDGMALLRSMAIYEATKMCSDDSTAVRVARETFPQFFANDPLECSV